MAKKRIVIKGKEVEEGDNIIFQGEKHAVDGRVGRLVDTNGEPFIGPVIDDDGEDCWLPLSQENQIRVEKKE